MNDKINGALIDLDARLARFGVKPFDVQVINDECGFIATSPLPIKDIDFSEFRATLDDMITSVGNEWSMPSNWLVSDPSMIGTDWTRLEFAIGRLQFKPSMQLSVINVFFLDPTDLLKMFIIMLDTAIMEDSIDSYALNNARDIMKNIGIGTDALHTIVDAQLMNERIVYAMLNKEETCTE